MLSTDIKKRLKKKLFLRYVISDANNNPGWAVLFLFIFFVDWKKVYERNMTKYLGAHTFSIGSGRMALYSLLQVFDIGDGDEVILPGYTCVVVPNAIIYAGARPIYIDINPGTFGIDCKKIELKISSRTKAIVIQHTYGIPSQLDEIIQLAHKHHLIIIEDCAHALGCEYNGKKLGTFGDAAYFSTDHTKMISTSIGGGIVLNNKCYLDKLIKMMSTVPSLKSNQKVRIYLQYLFYGFMAQPKLNWIGRYLIIIYNRLHLPFYFCDENIIAKDKILQYSYPVQISNFQAYIGNREFNRLEKNLFHRSNVVKKLETVFNMSYNGIPLLMFPLLVDDPLKWKKIFDPFIETFDWFSSIAYGKVNDFHEIGYVEGSCEIAEKINKHVIVFPTNLFIDSFGIKLVKRILKENKLENEMFHIEQLDLRM